MREDGKEKDYQVQTPPNIYIKEKEVSREDGRGDEMWIDANEGEKRNLQENAQGGNKGKEGIVERIGKEGKQELVQKENVAGGKRTRTTKGNQRGMRTPLAEIKGQ